MSVLELSFQGRARHSVRAVLCQPNDGAHGVTRPTNSPCPKVYSEHRLVRLRLLPRLLVLRALLGEEGLQ